MNGSLPTAPDAGDAYGMAGATLDRQQHSEDQFDQEQWNKTHSTAPGVDGLIDLPKRSQYGLLRNPITESFPKPLRWAAFAIGGVMLIAMLPAAVLPFGILAGIGVGGICVHNIRKGNRERRESTQQSAQQAQTKESTERERTEGTDLDSKSPTVAEPKVADQTVNPSTTPSGPANRGYQGYYSSMLTEIGKMTEVHQMRIVAQASLLHYSHKGTLSASVAGLRDALDRIVTEKDLTVDDVRAITAQALATQQRTPSAPNREAVHTSDAPRPRIATRSTPVHSGVSDGGMEM